MPTILKQQTGVSVNPRITPISPFELYLEQVKGVAEAIRVNSRGLSYIPAQFGGLKGQLITLNNQVVAQMIDFENNT